MFSVNAYGFFSTEATLDVLNVYSNMKEKHFSIMAYVGPCHKRLYCPLTLDRFESYLSFFFSFSS